MSKFQEDGPVMILRNGRWYWQKIDKKGKETLILVEPQPIIEKVKQGT
jgi:hypothetical protein